MADNDLPDLFSCSICLDILVEPRRLPKCSHVYCTACIESLVVDSRLTCPECRTHQYLTKTVTELPLDHNLQNLIEYFECCDCGQVHQFVCKCSICSVKVCPNCQILHTNERKCELIRKVIKLKSSLPDTTTNDMLGSLCEQWNNYMKNNCRLKQQVNEICENLIRRVRERREVLLMQISEMDRRAATNLEKLKKIISAYEFISSTWSVISEEGVDTSYQPIIEECNELQKLMSDTSDLKKFAVPAFVEVLLPQDVTHPIAEFISDSDISDDEAEDNIDTEQDDESESQVLWSGNASLSKLMCKRGLENYFYIGEGRAEVVRVNGSRCKMTLTLEDGRKLTWKWNNESETEATMDVNRIWLSQPFIFIKDGIEKAYNFDFKSEDEMHEFVDSMLPYAAREYDDDGNVII